MAGAIILPCIRSWRPKESLWLGSTVKKSGGALGVQPPFSGETPLTDSAQSTPHTATCPSPIPGKYIQPPCQGARDASLPALGVVDTFCLPRPGRCAMESLCGGNLCFLTSWGQWTTRLSLAAHSVLNVSSVVCFLLSQAGIFQLGVEKYSHPGKKSPSDAVCKHFPCLSFLFS